jgi:hypothetical protein
MQKKIDKLLQSTPGAFLHATNTDYVAMGMNRTLAKLMAKTDLKIYPKYFTDEKGRKCYTCTFKRHFMG